MTTVGKLAKRHGISRSTLLYYQRIGLLKPQGHRRGDYRDYTEADEARLERIILLRSAGLSPADIGAVLGETETALGAMLEARLKKTTDEIDALKAQQRITATLLGLHMSTFPDPSLTKERWEALLIGAGFSESDLFRWHQEFEATDPAGHLAFLRALQIDSNEIERIRQWAASTLDFAGDQKE